VDSGAPVVRFAERASQPVTDLVLARLALG
jgi:hypothetical protein